MTMASRVAQQLEPGDDVGDLDARPSRRPPGPAGRPPRAAAASAAPSRTWPVPPAAWYWLDQARGDQALAERAGLARRTRVGHRPARDPAEPPARRRRPARRRASCRPRCPGRSPGPAATTRRGRCRGRCSRRSGDRWSSCATVTSQPSSAAQRLAQRQAVPAPVEWRGAQDAGGVHARRRCRCRRPPAGASVRTGRRRAISATLRGQRPRPGRRPSRSEVSEQRRPAPGRTAW